MPDLHRPGHDRKTGSFATLRRTVAEFREDNLTDWAAALTYYGLLALFPAVIALISIVGLVADPQEIMAKLTEIVAQLGPASAVDTLSGPITSIAGNRETAGIMLVVGLLVALWSASSYVGAFMRASNAVYEVDEGRPIWKLRPLQMVVTLAMILLIALAGVAVIVTGPVADAVGGALGVGDAAVTAWDYAKWPVLLLIIGLAVAVLYYASPNAKVPGFRDVLPGVTLALVVWLVASVGFGFYVANFGSYDKTYGTLGGVVTFLVWLWITNVAILLGAELNAERERTREIARGVPGAERELRLGERDQPKEKQETKTA